MRKLIPVAALGAALVAAAPAAAHGTIKVNLQRGERVAWTGAPDSEAPAPRLTLRAPE